MTDLTVDPNKLPVPSLEGEESVDELDVSQSGDQSCPLNFTNPDDCNDYWDQWDAKHSDIEVTSYDCTISTV